MPEEDKDALDALESEAKEWEKDAEIERILNAFRLDAYGPRPLICCPVECPPANTFAATPSWTSIPVSPSPTSKYATAKSRS